MDIPLALLLVVLGAVLAFAVQNEPSGLDLDAVGWVAIIAGLVIIILSLYRLTTLRRERLVRRRITTYRERWPAVRMVEREIILPADRVIEREVLPPTTGRVVEREIYEDPEAPL